MQFLGKLNKSSIIDDYGHHPTEIRNTVIAIRESFPKEKITMVFQPHRFSRTKELYEEFVEVLQLVDELILLEIYPAGENPIKEISSSNLLNNIKVKGFKKAELAGSEAEAIKLIGSSLSKQRGILLIQGAGSISEISEKLIKKMNKHDRY